MRTSLAVSSGIITDNSKLFLIGGNSVLNLDGINGTGAKFNIYLDNDAGLIQGQSYTLTLAFANTTATSRFERNKNGGQLFSASDANVISGTGSYSFTNVQLTRGVLGSNSTLNLTFTPVPEPSLLFGAAVGLIGLVGLRKKLVKQA